MCYITMIYQGNTYLWECKNKRDAKFLRSSMRVLYPDCNITIVYER